MKDIATKVVMLLFFTFSTALVSAQDFCSVYPPVWQNIKFCTFSSNVSYMDLRDCLSQNYYNLNFVDPSAQFSVYLPYGTKQITLLTSHQTSISTFLFAINKIPSPEDVDPSTSPYINLISSKCIQAVCPYTNAYWSINGQDEFIQNLHNATACQNATYPTLACSSIDSLWAGKTYNVINNTVTLMVPTNFWQNHPNGAWLVVNWAGGAGTRSLGVTVDQDTFERWYENLNNKTASIECSGQEENSTTPMPEPQCDLDEHIDQCDESSCINVGGYWYDNTCHENSMSIKVEASNATIANNTLQVTFTCLPESDLDTENNADDYEYRWSFPNEPNATVEKNRISLRLGLDQILNSTNNYLTPTCTVFTNGHKIGEKNFYIFAIKGRIISGSNSTLPVIWTDKPYFDSMLLWFYNND